MTREFKLDRSDVSIAAGAGHPGKRRTRFSRAAALSTSHFASTHMYLRAFFVVAHVIVTATFSGVVLGAQQVGAASTVTPDRNNNTKKNYSQKILVRNGAASLEVILRGRGATVVMLPSLGRSVRDFDVLSERLVANGFRVVMPEPRGIGQSVGPTDKLTLHDLANDIAAIIVALGNKPVTLVGHAFGNRLARVLATDHPRLVKGVVLIAAGGLQPLRSEIRLALESCFDEQLPRDQRLAAIKLAFFADGNDPRVWETGWYKNVSKYQAAANAATPVKDWWAGGNARCWCYKDPKIPSQRAKTPNSFCMNTPTGSRPLKYPRLDMRYCLSNQN
jgi:pimeloyl-ACP methyl ester carboxylesterase